MKIIQISKTGGPDEMKLTDVPIPSPGPRKRWSRSLPAA